MTCGIYLGSPLSGLTDKVYIGQSIDIESRIKRHNYKFKTSSHTPKMQEAFNTFGEFSWEIIEECPAEQLDSRESYYINLYDSFTNGFNTYEDFSSAPILYGLDNGQVTKEYAELCYTILICTIANPNFSRHKVAELCGCKEHVVNHIWYGHTNKWLEIEYPELYISVRNLLNSRQIGGKSAEQQGIVYPVLLDPEFREYKVTNVREFSKSHKLDQGDLNNVLNMKVASVKGWIVKDLDVLNPELHAKFMSSNRGHYKKQFLKYKS